MTTDRKDRNQEMVDPVGIHRHSCLSAQQKCRRERGKQRGAPIARPSHKVMSDSSARPFRLPFTAQAALLAPYPCAGYAWSYIGILGGIAVSS